MTNSITAQALETQWNNSVLMRNPEADFIGNSHTIVHKNSRTEEAFQQHIANNIHLGYAVETDPNIIAKKKSLFLAGEGTPAIEVAAMEAAAQEEQENYTMTNSVASIKTILNNSDIGYTDNTFWLVEFDNGVQVADDFYWWPKIYTNTDWTDEEEVMSIAAGILYGRLEQAMDDVFELTGIAQN